MGLREDEQKINSHRRPESQEKLARPEIGSQPDSWGFWVRSSTIDEPYMTSVLGTMEQDEGLEPIDEQKPDMPPWSE